MLKFDISKLEKKVVYVTLINSKGDISYYDNENGKGKVKRIKSNKSIYTRMKAKKMSTRFIAPRESYITIYDGQAIGLDCCGITQYFYDGKNGCIKQDDSRVKELINAWHQYHLTYKQRMVEILEKENIPHNEIFFDGNYFCHIPEDIKTDKNKKWVCKDKNFFLTTLRCIDVELKFYQRKSFCFTFQKNEETKPFYVFFPTFSTTQETLRNKHKTEKEKQESEATEASIKGLDRINELYFVNLNFPVDSARQIGDVFGVGSLEWLNIESILLDLGILNLHQIDYDVRKVNLFNDNIKDCLAWLATFLYRVENSEQLNCIRNIYSKLLNPKQHLTEKSILEKMKRNTYIPNVIDVSELRVMAKNDLRHITIMEEYKKYKGRKKDIDPSLINEE